MMAHSTVSAFVSEFINFFFLIYLFIQIYFFQLDLRMTKSILWAVQK